jgi:hypothetical protein
MQTLKFSKPFSSLFQVKTLNMLGNRVGTWATLVTKATVSPDAFHQSFFKIWFKMCSQKYRKINSSLIFEVFNPQQ